MRLGLIARADNTGLGTQTLEFYRHMHPAKTLIVDICHLSPKRLTLYPERFPNATVSTGFPDAHVLDQFLQDLDIVYTAETPYNYSLFTMARERGIKTILHVNPEMSDYQPQPHLPRPDVFALPTYWLASSVPDPKVSLPVPVALDRFIPNRDEKILVRDSVNFVHVIGTPAAWDRAGTKDLIRAFRYIIKPCTITLRCQDMAYVSRLLNEAGTQHFPDVTMVIDPEMPSDYWKLYKPEYDVMIQPRRYGGLNLPAQEALAAGLPVIMPNISPNNDLLPGSWLVPARHDGGFMAKMPIDIYRVDPHDLANEIDRFADPQYVAQQKARARAYAEFISWNVLKPLYDNVFEDIIAGKELAYL